MALASYRRGGVDDQLRDGSQSAASA